MRATNSTEISDTICCRPRESGDPYAAAQRCGTTDENNIAWWLWVPAFAGTTAESQCRSPDGAKRNPGRTCPLATLFPHFADAPCGLQTAASPPPRFRSGSLEQNVVAANTCPQYSQVSRGRSRRVGPLVVPRFDPKRQLTRVPVDHNGAESLYDRVGLRVKLCRLASYLAALLHAVSALNETGLRIDDRSVPQTKIDAEGAVTCLRF